MKVLHLTHTDINNDSRILKEIESLRAKGFSVDGLGVLEPNIVDIELNDATYPALSVYSRKLQFLPKRVRHFFTLFELIFKMLRFAKGKGYRVIHCHDTMILPVGLLIKLLSNVYLIYDAHELESNRNGVGRFLSLLILAIERISWSRIDHLIVVSESIGKWYCEKISQKDYTVILNAPIFDSGNLQLDNKYLRDRFSISEDDKIFVYVGILGPGRGVDLFLEVFSRPSITSHLVFIGFGEYETKIREASVNQNNIHLHARVRHEEVVPIVASADFGLCLIENVSLSDFYCLPNKLFEYLFAGLPVISSDFPEISALLESLQCGRTADLNSDSLAVAVNQIPLDETIAVNFDSLEVLSWQTQAEKLGFLYKTI